MKVIWIWMCTLTCNSSNWTFQVGPYKAWYMSPKAGSDHVDGAQRGTMFLKRSVICLLHTTQSWHFYLDIAITVPECIRYISYLHLFNESSDIVRCFACVLYCLKIINISSSVVPVHYDDINIIPGQQQLSGIWHPYWWRSIGPIPMNDEGSWSGQVKTGMVGQVWLGNQCTTGAIKSSVHQEPDFESGSNDCLTKI